MTVRGASEIVKLVGNSLLSVLEATVLVECITVQGHIKDPLCCRSSVLVTPLIHQTCAASVESAGAKIVLRHRLLFHSTQTSSRQASLVKPFRGGKASLRSSYDMEATEMVRAADWEVEQSRKASPATSSQCE